MTLEELLTRLREEDLEQARQMSPAQKLRAGGDLFDDACRWTRAGIRQQHPDWNEQQVLDELKCRVDQARLNEERVT